MHEATPWASAPRLSQREGGLIKTPAKHKDNERHQDHSRRVPGGTKRTNEFPKRFQGRSAETQIPDLLGFAWITNHLDLSCFISILEFLVM